MAAIPEIADQLLSGPLWAAAGGLPLSLAARWCDVRSRFIPKGRVGRGERAVARNGRVLLAGDRPLAELAGCAVRVRVQVWHKVILPGRPPEPFGLLLCVRGRDDVAGPLYETRLSERPGEAFDLALDVGGGRVLEFRRDVPA